MNREKAFADPCLTLGQIVSYLICPEKARLQYDRGLLRRTYDWALRDAVKAAVAAYYSAIGEGREPTGEELRSAMEDAVLDEDAEPIRYARGETAGALLAEAEALAQLLRQSTMWPQEVLGTALPYRVELGRDVPPLAGTIDVLFRPTGPAPDSPPQPPVPLVVSAAKRRWSDGERVHNIATTTAATAAALCGMAPESEPLRVAVVQFVRTKRPALEFYKLGRVAQQSVELYRTALGVHRAFQAGAFPLNRGWGCVNCPFDGRECGQ